MNLYQSLFLRWQRKVVIRYLEEARGNQCKAARMLGIHRNTMQRVLREAKIGRQELGEIRKKTREYRKIYALHDVQTGKELLTHQNNRL